MTLNFVTVCTDKYPMLYAEKITNQFKRHTRLDLEYYCITDRPQQVNGWATPITPFKKSKGWWNKVNVFSDKMPDDWSFKNPSIGILLCSDPLLFCLIRRLR